MKAPLPHPGRLGATCVIEAERRCYQAQPLKGCEATLCKQEIAKGCVEMEWVGVCKKTHGGNEEVPAFTMLKVHSQPSTFIALK